MLHDQELNAIHKQLRTRLAMTHWKNNGMLWQSLLRCLAEIEMADLYTQNGQKALADAERRDFPGAPASREEAAAVTSEGKDDKIIVPNNREDEMPDVSGLLPSTEQPAADPGERFTDILEGGGDKSDPNRRR